MASPLFLDEQEYYPPEYKIVDLPIINIPVFQPLQVYNAKIYRQVDGQWKRLCHGKIKVVECEYVVVSAFENWSCHNRMREIPKEHPTRYNLVASQEYPYNWVFMNEQNVKLSIALSEGDFAGFKGVWDQIKHENSLMQEEKWLSEIEIDLFD